jgi:hypothetical protein
VPAARLLREAIVHQPTNVTLHYYLAIAATHLDLREEAIREFQWVLTNAPAGSAEALAAKQWLTAAGVLAGPATATAPEPPAADAATGPVGGLHGQGFNFAKIVPGSYKLTNRVAGKPHWRLRVDVAAGQPVTIDLNPQNSTRTRDDFPEDDK